MPIGDHPFAAHTQEFIMGLASFRPYPTATAIRRKRRRKSKIRRKTTRKAS